LSGGLTGERSEVWARMKDADFLTGEEKRQAVGY
jgi:phage portal protein BeeE